MNHIFGNEANRLEISSADGSIVSFKYHDNELLLESSAAFSLRLLVVASGEYRYLTSNDFSDYHFSDGCSCWTGACGYEGLAVKCKVSFDGVYFRFRPSVTNVPAAFWVELIDIPQMVVSDENEIFWPHGNGFLLREPWLSNRERTQIGFPGDNNLNVYPGPCPMQFFATWGDEYGVYFAADDYSHSPKALEVNPDGKNRVQLRMECTCGESGTTGFAELKFDIVMCGFSGDWQDACEIYRKWVDKDPAMKRTCKLPKWLDESPVVVVYPVCGTGTISTEPNKFQPYDKAFPKIKELSEVLESPIMAHLMRWDQNGPWMPPYHWPPVGDIDSFFRFRDLLHESGNYLGLYGSGTSYTLKSKISGYSDEKNYNINKLENHMSRGPKGEVTAKICHELREGNHLCISEKWAKDVLLEQVRLAAKNGVDYFQLFDQNHGGQSFACYSREHNHPPLPGVWQTENMVKLIDELNEEIRSVGSDMILGAESAAAGPYIAGLPFNDIRELGVYGVPVPATSYVFHKYCNNFFGNQVESYSHIDCVTCADNMQFRLSCGFVRGELLTVTLRDTGEIDWGAASDWSKPAPKQEPILQLIKEFNNYRRIYSNFLAQGEMQKPFASINCGSYRLKYIRKSLSQEEIFPALSSATWTAPDGAGAQFIVNFREEPEHATITPAGSCRMMLNSDVSEHDNVFSVIIPPLSVAVLLF